MRIEDGGLVTNSSNVLWTAIGSLETAHGTVQVVGKDSFGIPSRWTIAGPLLGIGSEGQGTLEIAEGGQVTVSGGTHIAMHPGSNGSSATVTGQDSLWAVSGPLYVGGFPDTAGKLIVANDGQVTAGSVKVWQPGTVELNDNGIISTGDFELAGGKLQGIGTVLVSGQLANAGVVFARCVRRPPCRRI